ncbi:MAG TPA: hypothetical protein VMI56_07605 [Reyranella sp.]|nr:hypothetical protein [Reyranella sp.]
MQKFVAAAAFVLLAAATAQAQQASYTWTGMGVNASGSSKCPTYKMTINVDVDGTTLKGHFQQQGRDERHFETTVGAGGAFKGKAQVGGGGTMDVTGTISDKRSDIILDGYCKFGGVLTKK